MAPVLMALLLGSASSWAADGFQDAKWGMSPDEVRAVLPPKACRIKLAAIGDLTQLTCLQTVAGVERTDVYYGFKDDRLEQVYANPSVDDNRGVPIARNILAGLTSKYGQPESGWDPDVRSACSIGMSQFGVPGLVASWSKQGVDLMGADMDDGSSIVHICYIEVTAAAEDAANKAKAPTDAAAAKAASGL